MAVLLGVPRAHAQPARACAPVTVAALHAPLRLDGRLNDWPAEARPIPIWSRAPAALRNVATVRYTWDARGLYAAFEVQDARLNVVPRDRLPLPDLVGTDAQVQGRISMPSDTLAMLYMSDSAELYLTADTAAARRLGPQHFQVVVDVRGAHAVLRGDNVLARLVPDWSAPKVVDRAIRIETAVHADGTLNLNDDRDGGYTIELAVPWASLGLAGPPRTPTLRLLGAVNDNEEPRPPLVDGDPYYPASACGTNDYGPPRTWPLATLAPASAPPAAPDAWRWGFVLLGAVGGAWLALRWAQQWAARRMNALPPSVPTPLPPTPERSRRPSPPPTRAGSNACVPRPSGASPRPASASKTSPEKWA